MSKHLSRVGTVYIRHSVYTVHTQKVKMENLIQPQVCTRACLAGQADLGHKGPGSYIKVLIYSNIASEEILNL